MPSKVTIRNSAKSGYAVYKLAEVECRPGDVSLLPSGHDAWVVGDAPAVVIDFQGMIDYAKSL